MFTVWGPTNHAKWFSAGSRHVLNPLRLICILKAWEEGRHCFSPSTPTPPLSPAHFPLYLTRCECHVVLSSTFACVAVSGGEVCLFCVTEEEKKQPPSRVVCCVIWSLALTVTNIRPFSVAGYVLPDGAACSLCQVIHGHGNMSRIQPRVSPRFAPLLHHHNYLKRKKGKNKQLQNNLLF